MVTKCSSCKGIYKHESSSVVASGIIIHCSLSHSSKVAGASSDDSKKQKAMGNGRQKSSEVATTKSITSVISGEMSFFSFKNATTAVVVVVNVSTFKDNQAGG